MELEINKYERKVVPPFFQIGLGIFTALFLTLIFGYRFTLFKSHDPRVVFKTITPLKFKEFGNFGNEVGIGLYIDQFEQFNIIKNEFLFTGQVWFMLAPGSLSLDTLRKFTLARGEILSCSAPYIRVIDDQLLVQYNIRARLNSPLNVADFPLDNHTICVQIEHLYTNPNELLFSPTIGDFRINANIKPFGWTITDTQVQSGYIERKISEEKDSKMQYYPTAIFYFDVVRYGIQYTLTIFLPLILIFFVILFCLSVRETSVSFSLAVGGLTTILAYRFVIVNMSPQVGYFMITDYVFLFILASGVCIFLTHVSDVFYGTILSLKMKKLFIAAMHAIVNLAFLYILYW
jgi:hypothetical protein